MAYNVLSGTITGLTTGSISLTGTFFGDGEGLSNTPGPDTVVNAADNRLMTFTSVTGKTLRGESNLTFDGDNLLFLTGGVAVAQIDTLGNISASNNVSAAFYYGDGRHLTGITASTGHGAQGPVGAVQFATGSGGMSGSAALLFNTSDNFLTIGGGLVLNRRAVTTNYTAAVDDYYLAVTNTPVSILFNSALFGSGRTFIVKDEAGTANVASLIILEASGAQTFDGSGSVEIQSPYGAVNVYTNGTNWFIY